MDISCDASCSRREPSASAQHAGDAQPSALMKPRNDSQALVEQHSLSQAMALALPLPPAPTRPEEQKRTRRSRRRSRSACWRAQAGADGWSRTCITRSGVRVRLSQGVQDAWIRAQPACACVEGYAGHAPLDRSYACLCSTRQAEALQTG